MKKRYLFLIFSFLVGVSLFFWSIKEVGWESIEEVFFKINFWQIIVLFVLTLLIPVLEGLRWKEVLKIEEREVSLKTSFKLGLAGFSISFLAPALVGAAEFFKGYFLKKEKKYSGPRISSSVILDRVIGWTVDAIFVVFGIVVFFIKTEAIPHDLLVNIGWVFIFLLSILLFFYIGAFKKISFVTNFHRFFNERIKNVSVEIERDIFHFFKISKKKTLKPFLISFLKDFVVCLRVWLVFYFLNQNIPFWSVFSVLSFSYLAMIIPVPASLGSHEALQLFVFNSLGLKSSAAIAFTMIVRGVGFLVSFLGLVLFFKISGSFLKKYFIEKEKE